ncbi:hypothetical protein [Allorhodopirellula solitaria]|uniref:Uncharacterized protein n=1 Tax=Allorhodopirellula solitaria TaxID=2527987 RepID=A0A5C5WMU5_9BACT|nr:hypothetical protein [Allorhodopirellula solitaria]TWT52156.1 hypothetical protein CA85_50700 [Allorhodopirellula solitaria]
MNSNTGCSHSERYRDERKRRTVCANCGAVKVDGVGIWSVLESQTDPKPETSEVSDAD